MAWILRAPETICSLREAQSLFATESCRIVAAAYLTILERSQGAIPDKSDFDLDAFAKALPHVALCAITRPDRCIYRVAGEILKRRIGFNPTGRNYYDLVPERRRPHAAHAMNMVVDVPCGFRAVIDQDYTVGPHRSIEAVGLPLRSGEPGVDGFIIFADEALDEAARGRRDDTSLVGANVVRRDLIDLGFGVDADFRDLVETD